MQICVHQYSTMDVDCNKKWLHLHQKWKMLQNMTRGQLVQKLYWVGIDGWLISSLWSIDCIFPLFQLLTNVTRSLLFCQIFFTFHCPAQGNPRIRGLKVRKCFLKNEIELILEKKVKHCNPLWPTRSSSDIACFKTLCIQLDTELLSRYLFILDIRYFMVSPDIGYWKFPRYLLLLGVKYFLILYFYTILLLLNPTCS